MIKTELIESGVRKVNEGDGDTFDCEVDADIEAEDLLSQLTDTAISQSTQHISFI